MMKSTAPGSALYQDNSNSELADGEDLIEDDPAMEEPGYLEASDSATIYHVPSFLLKTYEIVDVS